MAQSERIKDVWSFEFCDYSHTHFMQLFKGNLIIQEPFFLYTQLALPLPLFCFLLVAIVCLVFGSRLLLPTAFTKCTQHCTGKVFPFPQRTAVAVVKALSLRAFFLSLSFSISLSFFLRCIRKLRWRSNGTLS